MNTPLYTIGYATKPIEIFISQLQQHGITVVADIRSVPYSNAFFDYHQEAIIEHLNSHGIRYVYLGDELGPRSKDPAHYDDSGQIQFDRLMASALFTQGIQRLAKGQQRGFTIALMCAEKDPATCHRSLLVGYFLNRHSEQVIEHIHHDGTTETQIKLEQRLCQIHDMEADLFLSPQQRQQQAYELQLKQTSYRKPE